MMQTAAATPATVLVLGGTGRTGRLVLQDLLHRGCTVRAIVRSAATLPAALAAHPALTLVVGSVLARSHEDLVRDVRGCDAVVSCLGHTISLAGIFGPPYDLVTRATDRMITAIAANQPARHVRLILMLSVSVNAANGLDVRRTGYERVFLAIVRALLPPARDNQRAADLLSRRVGTSHPTIEWAAVRPDTLRAGELSAYTLHPEVVTSIFAPAHTRMANIAHFIGELVTDAATWRRWAGRCPVIVDRDASPPVSR